MSDAPANEDWNRWRGSVDAQLTDLPDRLATEVKHVGETLRLHLNTQDVKLTRIDEHTAATNGHLADAVKEISLLDERVVILETDKARAEGWLRAFRWLPIAAGSVMSIVGTVLIMALSGAIHL